MRDIYGNRTDRGPTAGVTAIVYRVVLPDGTEVKKRVFKPRGEGKLIATALRSRDGKRVLVVVWQGEPAWEGDFGRLMAERIA